jgi:hypothetical protein
VPFMVLVRYELGFQAVDNCVGFSSGRYISPTGSWIAVDPFGPSRFIRDFAICQIAWGVSTQFPIFISHRSSVYLRINLLTVVVTKLGRSPYTLVYPVQGTE